MGTAAVVAEEGMKLRVLLTLLVASASTAVGCTPAVVDSSHTEHSTFGGRKTKSHRSIAARL